MNLIMAERFSQLRKKAGFSQEELAAKLGISRQAVSKWERAESSPDTDNLIALSRLYGISLDELLLGDKQAKPSLDNEKSQAAEKTGSCSHAAYDNLPSENQTVNDDSKCTREAGEKLQGGIWERLGVIFPILICLLYCVLGAVWNLWHPMWILFLVIPVYYLGIYNGYPIIAAILFFLVGFIFDTWNVAWLLFLTIPVFYFLYSFWENKKNQEPVFYHENSEESMNRQH